MYEIKPLANGYGIYKNGSYIMWCHDMTHAEWRVEQMMEADKK